MRDCLPCFCFSNSTCIIRCSMRRAPFTKLLDQFCYFLWENLDCVFLTGIFVCCFVFIAILVWFDHRISFMPCYSQLGSVYVNNASSCAANSLNITSPNIGLIASWRFRIFMLSRLFPFTWSTTRTYFFKRLALFLLTVNACPVQTLGYFPCRLSLIWELHYLRAFIESLTSRFFDAWTKARFAVCWFIVYKTLVWKLSKMCGT